MALKPKEHEKFTIVAYWSHLEYKYNKNVPIGDLPGVHIKPGLEHYTAMKPLEFAASYEKYEAAFRFIQKIYRGERPNNVDVFKMQPICDMFDVCHKDWVYNVVDDRRDSVYLPLSCSFYYKCNHCGTELRTTRRDLLDKHWKSPRCRREDIYKSMVDNNKEVLIIHEDTSHEWLTGGQISFLQQNYAIAYGAEFNHQTWVTPELNKAVRAYLVQKIEPNNKSLPKILEQFNIQPNEKKMLQSKPITSQCSYSNCTNEGCGDGIISNSLTYPLCTEHSSVVMVALDKVLSDI